MQVTPVWVVSKSSNILSKADYEYPFYWTKTSATLMGQGFWLFSEDDMKNCIAMFHIVYLCRSVINMLFYAHSKITCVNFAGAFLRKKRFGMEVYYERRTIF